MERSRSDVYQRTIDEQNQKLEKYQTKLRDVVTAYKELQREKIALEESLKALSVSQSRSDEHEENTNAAVQSLKDVDTANEQQAADSSISAELSDSLVSTVSEGKKDNENEETGDGELSVGSLKHQLATLTSALYTVTEQKSKMEATYVSEKRKLKQDLEEMESQFNQEQEALQKRLHTLESENEQWRNKLRSQQYEREKELNDHAVVIKELQKVIGNERIAKEQLDNQLEDSRLLLADQQHVHATKSELYEKTIADLHQELDNARTQLKESKEKVAEPSSLLLHLQKELLSVKDEERRAVLAAQQRADDAEHQLQIMSQQSETRAVGLESRLSELSETLGNIERLRQQDQQIIQKLRERLVQLDMENTALTNATRVSPPVSSDNQLNADSELDTAMIIDKIQHLKSRLKTASDKAEKPLNICEVLLNEEENRDLHRKCVEQYDHLRDEFERYKLRAQSVLKNKSSASPKETDADREIVSLKSQLTELRERLAVARTSCDEQELKLHEKEEGFARAMAAMRESHRAELAERDSVHRQRASELEAEMRRHRDRTVSMLAERDREIASLRLQVVEQRLPTVADSTFQHDADRPTTEYSEVGASSAESPAVAVVSELIANVGVADEAKILHFAHERSRYEAEAAGLRRQKYSLETALREARRDAALAAELHSSEIHELREDLAKRDRDRSRETANLEYLKNVVHRYMICCGGASARQQMLNAIATILQFSPTEKQQVQAVLARGWWVTKSP